MYRMTNNAFYTISEVAKILGVSTRTLKNYEKQGKIPQPMRSRTNSWRVYTEEDIDKLKALFFPPMRFKVK